MSFTPKSSKQSHHYVNANTPYLSVFSLNAGKYGPEKLRIRTLFTQCKEVIFSHKDKDIHYPLTYFNDTVNNQVAHQIHLGLILEKALLIKDHINSISSEVWKTIDLLRKLNKFFPRSSLVTIYKLFLRLHLDYAEVIFDKTFNHTFHQKLESPSI